MYWNNGSFTLLTPFMTHRPNAPSKGPMLGSPPFLPTPFLVQHYTHPKVLVGSQTHYALSQELMCILPHSGVFSFTFYSANSTSSSWLPPETLKMGYCAFRPACGQASVAYTLLYCDCLLFVSFSHKTRATWGPAQSSGTDPYCRFQLNACGIYKQKPLTVRDMGPAGPSRLVEKAISSSDAE
jgi:hypothetical protein